MQNIPRLESARVIPLPARGGTTVRRPPVETERDREFVGMLKNFRETGGLQRGDEVAALLAQRGTGDVARLARWLVSRDAVGFDWRGELWVPMFQFQLHTMTLRPEAVRVSSELAAVFDPWALSLWFATPNAWLEERLPADALAGSPDAVREAARADRFAVRG